MIDGATPATGFEHARSPRMAPRSRMLRLATVAAIVLGAAIRISVVTWSDPWGPHHPDEHIVPLEALALWEGVTPQEVGWPATTSVVAFSALSATQFLSSEAGNLWRMRSEPDRALNVVTSWIGRQFVEPGALYRTGRTLSVVVGVLHLFAVAWALGRWTGPAGVLVGTLAAAIAPVAVEYSQYVLADIAGLLFATVVVGLAAEPTPRRTIVMGAVVGLAAASKFHFGLWLLTPLLCVWFGDAATFRTKVRLTVAVAAVCAWVVVTLVPWFWINPLLAVKEFAGVVLVKVSSGSPAAGVAKNAAVLFGGLGALTWVGALAGARILSTPDVRRALPVLVPTASGAAILVASTIVFDRYALVLFPGVLLVAAIGWQLWLRDVRRTPRMIATAVLLASLAITIGALVRAQRRAGEIDVDVLARNWILANVARGSGVAVYNEVNAFLPRAAEQLRQCADHVDTADAYREKWLVEGVTTALADGQPMRSMLLNDERFHAYWCRRELAVQTDPGFLVVPYHGEPRFGAVRERDVLAAFRSDARNSDGLDVLVTNRVVEVGRQPVQVFRTARGQRVIYRR